MRRLGQFVAALLLLLAPNLAAARPQREVAVRISRAGDGGWIADYAFAEKSRAWVFIRSNPDMDGAPWRLKSWKVETPGVSLVRIGRWDAIVAEKGAVPARVRIRMTSFTKSLRAAC